MKARALRPAYWKDRQLAGWTAAQREFYQGCWMLADDAGIMRADPWEIAAELYPYREAKSREATVRKLWDHLIIEGKVLPLACGRHASVPAVQHHSMGGRPAEYIFKEHQSRCIEA